MDLYSTQYSEYYSNITDSSSSGQVNGIWYMIITTGSTRYLYLYDRR